MSPSGVQVLPPPGTWRSDPARTYIGFVARHLMVQRVRGRFEEFDVTVDVADPPEASAIRVELGATSINTGAPDRDAQAGVRVVVAAPTSSMSRASQNSSSRAPLSFATTTAGR